MTTGGHPLKEYARHVQEEFAKDPALAHPSYAWCLMQVERHMGYVVGGGADTKEKKMEKLVIVDPPAGRYRERGEEARMICIRKMALRERRLFRRRGFRVRARVAYDRWVGRHGRWTWEAAYGGPAEDAVAPKPDPFPTRRP